MIEPNPLHTLLQMAAGYCLSRCLHVVANLGVADALEETPRTAAELAAAVGANPDALGRALRLLSAHGVFVSEGSGFRHSAASRLLRSDHPQSARAITRMLGLPIHWKVLEALEDSVRSGLPSVDQVVPEGLWPWYAKHPEENALFNAAMVGKAHGQVAGVLSAYDFSPFSKIGDIGGGRGHLLQAVLEAAPGATGVLFDQPHVIAESASLASKRLSLQSGDFFKDALPACDAYLVMEVIHDWNDHESIAILRAIRKAAPRHAKLLLIEELIPDDPGPHWSKTLDILMLSLLGGAQRTRQEYAALFKAADFSLVRVVDTGGISILEAVPV